MNIIRALFGGVKEIRVERYSKRYAPQQHVVIDVRNNKEFDSGHLDGALNIPLNKLPKRLKEIPEDKPIVCVSRDGVRGREAADLLQRAGYDAANLVGGIRAWEQSGGKVI